MNILWWVALLLLPGLAAGKDTPEAFAYAIPVEVPAGSGLARVTVPAAVYEAVAHEDLRDVRVFDGAGRTMPYAWQPPQAPSGTTRAAVLSLFPIHAHGALPAQGARLRLDTHGSQVIVEVDQPAAGSTRAPRLLRGYLVDLGKDAPPLASLRFEWRNPLQTPVLSVSIERGDDLDHWQSVASNITLAKLRAQEQDLVRDTVDLEDVRARYLRVTFPGMEPVPILEGVQGQLREGAAPLARSWKDVAGRAGGEGEREFDLEGFFPVDRVQLTLNGESAVLPVEIHARRKSADPWQSVTRATFYRLEQDARVVSNAEVAVPLSRERYWKVRVLQAGGEASIKSLRVGWVPGQLVFVAQGEAPYRLAYGRGNAADAALPIATVVPGYGSARASAAVDARPGAQQVLAGPAARERPVDAKRLALWGALAAGVLLLAWMAWSLGRQLKNGQGAK